MPPRPQPFLDEMLAIILVGDHAARPDKTDVDDAVVGRLQAIVKLGEEFCVACLPDDLALKRVGDAGVDGVYGVYGGLKFAPALIKRDRRALLVTLDASR
jgi:hypothetical protein